MRTFKAKTPRNPQPFTGWGASPLNTEAGLGIYARQSTFAQVKNYRQSTEMQTEDLVTMAKHLGWSETHIIVFTQDLAKSGKLRIDQREGLRTLIEHIEAGDIKTVLVFLEDRLFRDETGIQYNVFIDVCKRHEVMVVTPHMTYDFNNPFHVKQFRWRCEEAADYLRDYVKYRLHGAKNRISESGRYAGRAIPVGYIIDREETILVEGKLVPNPTHRKFLPYLPHVKIVRSLFKRYWELNGTLRSLCRELQKLPFVFPDFEPDIDVSKYLSQYHLKKVSGGYHISRPGLKGLLTNVAYIGYWMHLGAVISKDNHEAIVEEDLFWYAFNRLSPYTITGEKNELRSGYTRYSRKEPIPALLKQVISSREGGRVYVSTSGLTEKPIYIIEEKDQRLVLKYHAATPCAEIDALFSERLLERMKTTKRYEHYQDYAQELHEEQEKINKSIKDQLAEIDKQMEGILTTLSLPAEKVKTPLREKLSQKYSVLEDMKEDLQTRQVTLQTDQKTTKLMTYYTLTDRLAEHWDAIPFEDKQDLANALVTGVYIDEMTAHWLRLEIEWLDPAWGTERTYLQRKMGGHKTWTDEENEIITEHYPKTAREEILAMMPRRSWSAIVQQAKKIPVSRPRHMISTCGIPDHVSMDDLAFMKAAGITSGKRYCSKWETAHQLPTLTLKPFHPLLHHWQLFRDEWQTSARFRCG